MASASLLKSSTILDKSEWVKGQTLRQPSVSVVRCYPSATSAINIRASYADELVKTAVSSLFLLRLVLHNVQILTNLWTMHTTYK